MKKIILLGSTGSIGTQTISVCQACGFSVVGLSAGHNVALLAKQAKLLKPKTVCIADEKMLPELRLLAGEEINVTAGKEALCALAAADCDIVLNAVVGMAGLPLTMAALCAGNTLALANKESLVAGGSLVTKTAAAHQVSILPVDSEHSAIFQCLQGCQPKMLHKLLLTASGGPFFGKTREDLANITVEQALCHPNWSMGRKITVDSATMMNKGLEIIEACHLFSVRPEQIEVLVQRESIVHSAVELIDHSVIAQLGIPDMRIPIQYALTYPDRLPGTGAHLDLAALANLTFAKPDDETFRCPKLCIRAMEEGGAMCCVANAANEAAVALFLDHQLSFLAIADAVEQALDAFAGSKAESLDALLALDLEVRTFVLKTMRSK